MEGFLNSTRSCHTNVTVSFPCRVWYSTFAHPKTVPLLFFDVSFTVRPITSLKPSQKLLFQLKKRLEIAFGCAKMLYAAPRQANLVHTARSLKS